MSPIELAASVAAGIILGYGVVAGTLLVLIRRAQGPRR